MMVLSVSDNGKCFTAGLKSVSFLSLSPQDLDGPLGILVCLFVSAVLEYTGTWECIYHASNQSTWTNGPPSRYRYVFLCNTVIVVSSFFMGLNRMLQPTTALTKPTKKSL